LASVAGLSIVAGFADTIKRALIDVVGFIICQ